ncbi:hypothetical protein ACQEU5_20385 [Marinactinospora thermotolerans]|uniref:Uncharacterized protein n=1 Tax=Marinactinospora thermotolerans DSM 45154 TaxID=1122192 RepID=A0A1T4PU42_9ACTN|nr:hypothetical protein [Marinactinospora thermotolerans]SJZ94836.1 hypothetical protein SAMN02745673_01992 [Marinactinospora thermotolerans DSM 45154]
MFDIAVTAVIVVLLVGFLVVLIGGLRGRSRNAGDGVPVFGADHGGSDGSGGGDAS